MDTVLPIGILIDRADGWRPSGRRASICMHPPFSTPLPPLDVVRSIQVKLIGFEVPVWLDCGSDSSSLQLLF